MRIIPMACDRKEQLDAGIDAYLAYCYEQRTAARSTELAAFLRISYRHLTRLCARFLGVQARVALRSRQLSYAASLLRGSTTRIDEIGIMCGFGDPGTFYRAIRKEFGCSPTELRNAALDCH